MFSIFILLYFLSLIVGSFWNFSFDLIKILCCFAIFGDLLESHFLLGIQVLIYAMPGHFCDTFLLFSQGSVTYFMSVVMTHKP